MCVCVCVRCSLCGNEVICVSFKVPSSKTYVGGEECNPTEELGETLCEWELHFELKRLF